MPRNLPSSATLDQLVFHFAVNRSIPELEATRGQALIYRPGSAVASCKLITLLPAVGDDRYERAILTNRHGLCLNGRAPATNALDPFALILQRMMRRGHDA